MTEDMKEKGCERSGLVEKVDKVCEQMMQELYKLDVFVMNPVYEPDHPVGRRIMNDSSLDFKRNANTQSKGSSSVKGLDD